MTAWVPALFRERTPDGRRVRLELWNAFAALAGTPFPLGEGASLRHAFARPPAGSAWCTAVEVEAPEGILFLHMRDFPFEAVAGVAFSASDIAGLPEPLRRAVTEGMLECMRGLLPAGLPAAFTITGEGMLRELPGASRPDMEWLAVEIDGVAPLSLLAGAPRDWLLRVLALTSLPAGGPAGPLTGHIRVAADVTAGSILLTRREFASLRPGDVAVMPEDADGAVTVRVGDVTFAFQPAGDDGWLCSGPRSRPRHRPAFSRPLPPENAMDDPSLTALDDIPFAIDFDLGRLHLPLAAIASWTEGTVLELPFPAADTVPVTIRVNGDVVGTGDILRIDDRIGVRITTISSSR